MVKMKWCGGICVSMCLFWSSIEIAKAGNGTRLPRSGIAGIRPLAMGQAFTAVADDQNALYYNPAGLGRINRWSLEILSPSIGWNQNLSLDKKEQFESLAASMGGDTSKSLDALDSQLKNFAGENYHTRVSLNPYFFMRNFGFAAFSGFELNLMPHNPGESLADLSLEADADIRVGGAYHFFGEKLNVGATIAYRSRGVAATSIDLDWLSDLSQKEKRDARIKEAFQAGWGVGLDTGVLFTPVETWSPTLGLTILNVGDLKFKKYDKLGSVEVKAAPAALPQSVNVGLSVTPRWNKWFLRAAWDFRDLNLPIEQQKKYGLGFEGGWDNLASVQLGLAEDALTAGFEFRLFVLNVRYATYVTERGYFPSQTPERRHLLGFKVLL
jgi:hypothetical protein